MTKLPAPRGSLSERLFEALGSSPRSIDLPPVGELDGLTDEDLQLSLYCCYELHYRGFDGVDPDWEWEPSLLGFRAQLENRFESALHDLVARSEAPVDPRKMDLELRKIADSDDGPSL